MTDQSEETEPVRLEELVVSHSYEMIALITVLERKGILTRNEIIEVIQEMSASE